MTSILIRPWVTFLCILIRDFPVIVFTATVLIRIVDAQPVWMEFRDVYILSSCQSTSSTEPFNWSSGVTNGPALTVRRAFLKRLQTRRPCQSLGDMRHTPTETPNSEGRVLKQFHVGQCSFKYAEMCRPVPPGFQKTHEHSLSRFFSTSFLNKVENTFNSKSPHPVFFFCQRWLSEQANPGTTVKWHRDICDLPLIPVTDLPAGWEWALARPCQTTKSTQGEYLWIKM